MPGPVPLVRTVRSGVVESIHLGSVVVADADGRVLAAVGDPDRLTFTRSCAKPIQAAVSASATTTPLPDDLLALSCGSHTGETAHVAGVRRILRRAGLGVAALACPPDRPSRGADAKAVRRASPVFHNCSGKHAAMLLACVDAGWDPATYVAPRHPLQRRVLDAIRRASDAEPTIGVDGCGVPVHAIPLRSVATAFARLSAPQRLGSLAAPVARATAAMVAHPFLVAGTGRSDTALMTAVPGLVTKVGAEGLHAATFLGTGIGVAVRIEDGADRAAAPALLEALVLAGLVDRAASERADLAPIARRAVLGGGRAVGEIRAGFALRRAR
ncbi:MAG: asparaginase [Actinomycetota bacterium]